MSLVPRGQRQPRDGRRRSMAAAASLGAVLLGGLAAATPGSSAAFVATIANTTDTVTTRTYFTCAAAVSAAAPRIYYRLDESAGATTATDSSGQARNGTYQGTSTKGVATGCVRDSGTAVTFDGATGYVDLASSLTVPTTFSIEAWFRTTTTSGGLVAGFGASATGASATVDRVIYMTDAGGIAFGVNNASKTTVSANGPYNDGKWHHVIATVGTSGMRLYLDGGQVASSATTATAGYSGFFRVGYDNLTGWTSAPASGFFKGTLDEVAAYSTALTATDATNHYQAGI